MKEPKSCGRKELNELFTRINTIIEDNRITNAEAAIVVDRIGPMLECFIDEYYPDVRPFNITTFLWVWFEQRRAKCGDWDMPSAA